jgi:hypothetical protein
MMIAVTILEAPGVPLVISIVECTIKIHESCVPYVRKERTVQRRSGQAADDQSPLPFRSRLMRPVMLVKMAEYMAK